MTEKRYYQKNYDELCYFFDSKILSKEEFEEKVEYDDYAVFAYSLTPHEVVDLLNENEELKQVNKKILDAINNKITEKGIDWYKAEDNSKEEKEANLQLNILEEIRDELKEILNLIKGD